MISEEKELLQLAKNSETAVEELLNLYKPLVSKIARQYFLVGGEIDDLIQEGMIGLFRAIQTYDDTKNASFKTFATLCIKRKMQSAIRNANANKNLIFNELFDDEMLDYIEQPSEKENPEKKAISKENYKYIKNEIKTKLSNFEYEVLQKYVAGLSYIDIANHYGVSKKSIDNALFRIRGKLMHLLDDTNY